MVLFSIWIGSEMLAKLIGPWESLMIVPQKKAWLLIGLTVALAPGIALAEKVSRQSSQSIVSATEAQQELFGVRLSGETAANGAQWSECIEPDGRTVYRIEGVEMIGKLSITETGQACFSYAQSQYARKSCFRVSRGEDGYIFWGGIEGVFHATSIERDVRECPAGVTPLS